MRGSLKIWTVILGIVVVGIGITLCTESYVSRQIEKIAVTAERESHEEEAFLGEAKTGGDREEAALGEKMSTLAGPGQDSEKYSGEETAIAQQPEEASVSEALAQRADQEESYPETEGALEAEEEAEADLEMAAAMAEEMVPNDDVTNTTANTAPLGAASRAGGASSQGENSSVLVEIAEYPVDLQEALKEYQERFPQIDAQIEQMRRAETENNNMYSVKNAAQTEQRIWDRELEGIYRLLCDSLDETSCQVLKKEQQEWLLLRDARAEEAAKKNSGGSLESVDYIASVAASNRERAYDLLEKYQE